MITGSGNAEKSRRVRPSRLNMDAGQTSQPMAEQAIATRLRSDEELNIIESIERTREQLNHLHKRLEMEERITDLKAEADKLRYSVM